MNKIALNKILGGSCKAADDGNVGWSGLTMTVCLEVKHISQPWDKRAGGPSGGTSSEEV